MAALLRLSNLLAEAGSVWRVRDDSKGLIRRVDTATQALVDAVAGQESDAAFAIRKAWAECYGRQPDYDAAYSHAVKAVEAVVLPVTSPNDQTATLGKALATVRDTSDLWTIGGLDDSKKLSGDTLHAMLQTLWHAQERHAASDRRRGKSMVANGMNAKLLSDAVTPLCNRGRLNLQLSPARDALRT